MVWEVVISIIFIILLIKLLVHLTNIRCKSKVCLVGRTALVTGGNSGLGLELVKQLALRGCTIIIADKVDATRTVSNVIKETHNLNITAKNVDFTSFKSVRLFAEDLKRSLDKLDILVNNAGIGDNCPDMTEDGIEKILQVNYFSHFLLTHLLIDLLLKSAPSRIIYSSSMAAYIADLSEENFKARPSTGLKLWWSLGSYGNSKLAGAIMSKILSEKLDGTGVTSNTYHPGICKTNIWNAKIGIPMMCIDIMWKRFFGKTTEEGVQTLLHLICADEVKDISGKFFMECTSVFQPIQVYNEEFCSKIWSLSEEYTNLKKEERMDVTIQHWFAGK